MQIENDPAYAPTMVMAPTRVIRGGAAVHVPLAAGSSAGPPRAEAERRGGVRAWRGGARARRRRLAIAGGALAATIAAGTALLALARAPGAAPPPAGVDRLAVVWSPERAAVVEAAVGPAAWAALGPAVARFVDGWSAGHGGPCLAPAPSSTASSTS